MLDGEKGAGRGGGRGCGTWTDVETARLDFLEKAEDAPDGVGQRQAVQVPGGYFLGRPGKKTGRLEHRNEARVASAAPEPDQIRGELEQEAVRARTRKETCRMLINYTRPHQEALCKKLSPPFK
jgi:hypothetical protein